MQLLRIPPPPPQPSSIRDDSSVRRSYTQRKQDTLVRLLAPRDSQAGERVHVQRRPRLDNADYPGKTALEAAECRSHLTAGKHDLCKRLETAT